MSTVFRRFRALLAVGLLVGCAPSGESIPALEGPSGNAATTPDNVRQQGSLGLAITRAVQRSAGRAFVVGDGGKLTALVGPRKNPIEASIDRGRVSLTPRDGTAGLALHTSRIGRAESNGELAPIRSTGHEGPEAVLSRDGFEEHYLAGSLGIEQSYVVDARPAGRGPLVVEVEVEGARAERSPVGAKLVDARGTVIAAYRDLAAFDADGREIPSHMQVDGNRIGLVVDDDTAKYPLLVDPLVAIQDGTVNPSPYCGSVGCPIRVSGDTAVVGAQLAGPNSEGRAYVFLRTGFTWSQEAELQAADASIDDYFGYDVAISGDTALIGTNTTSNGRAYIFRRTGTTWAQEAEIFPTPSFAWDFFGNSVALEGDLAVIGAPGDGAQVGYVYGFSRSGTTWSQESQMVASDTFPGDHFGLNLAMSGNSLIVGSDVAAAYVFTHDQSTWSFQARLPEDGVPLDDPSWVSIEGDTAVLGDPISNRAFIFARSGTTWAKQQELVPFGTPNPPGFGVATSMVGDRLLVGADGYGSNVAVRGAAYLFTRTGTTWAPNVVFQPVDSSAGDLFGTYVELFSDGAMVSGKAADVFYFEKGVGEPCTDPAECASDMCVANVCVAPGTTSSSSVSSGSVSGSSGSGGGNVGGAGGATGSSVSSTSSGSGTASSASSSGSGGAAASTNGNCSCGIADTSNQGAFGFFTALGVALAAMRRRGRNSNRFNG